MAPFNTDLEFESLTPLSWVGIVLAAVTGVVHLGLGLAAVPGLLGIAAVLAAIAYAIAIGLILVDYRRKLIMALGIPFVGSQILLWYVLNSPSSLAEISLAAMIDKTVQILLLGVLFTLLYRESDGR